MWKWSLLKSLFWQKGCLNLMEKLSLVILLIGGSKLGGVLRKVGMYNMFGTSETERLLRDKYKQGREMDWRIGLCCGFCE